MRIVNRDLRRRVKFQLGVRDAAGTPVADAGGDGLTLSGYAAVFGVPTRIASWEGRFDETVKRGAFKKTLAERAPVMQFDHGRHPLIGSIPIGTYESLSEDSTGLAVEGRLMDNWLVSPVRDAIANKSINGMSFRFDVVRDTWTTGSGKPVSPDDDAFWELLWMGDDNPDGALQRTLVEVKLPEAGPVVFPAYDTTTVSVRARDFAASVMGTPELVRSARSALAMGAPMSGTMEHELPGSDALRSEIARAILFGGVPLGVRSAVPADPGHPAPEDDPDDDPDEDDDAPAEDEGHPPTDAPEDDDTGRDDAPADSHPSLSPLEQRQKRLRMDYLTRNRVRK